MSCSCHVRINGLYSEEFGMGVGVHQGSVVILLFFILVLEVPLCMCCTGVLWELLYAADLVLIVDTKEGCIPKLQAWKAGIESKALHVNIEKTKFLVAGVGLDVFKKPGIPELSVSGVSAATLLSVCSASCRSTRGSVALLVDWWPTQTISVPCVTASLAPSTADQSPTWMSTARSLIWT